MRGYSRVAVWIGDMFVAFGCVVADGLWLGWMGGLIHWGIVT
jgi:hypothetical protein